MDREMNRHFFFMTVLILGFGSATMTSAIATTFPESNTPFSKYGQIQNVQNYSSNPFWDPSSPYNQRMPVPVYVQGTDVSSSDCQIVVSALVATYCSSRNNCVDVDVEDARPTLTVQLASLPNHNYVTPCASYIDTEFSKYVSQNALAVPSIGTYVPFPTATTSQNTQKAEFQNPYSIEKQLPTWNGDPWAQEMLERKQELENLQSSAESYGDSKLAKAEFPKTASDLTFTQRIQNDTAGYAPYKNAESYNQINVVDTNNNGLRAYCTTEIMKLSTLNADLATLQNCRSKNIAFAECQKQLRGTY